ncbi:MAG: chemotaxis protein CheA [Caldimicrobium sp.]|nr:chemotaxis protein CheA [Caldimicrobium sp.]
MSSGLLEQFILESREGLQRISEILITLEEKGEDKGLLNELFRLVHTMKGNSGLFDLPSMTKLLHASEDLMNLVREGKVSYNSEIADILFSAMDIVSTMLDELETSGSTSSETNSSAEEKAKEIRSFIEAKITESKDIFHTKELQEEVKTEDKELAFNSGLIPEEARMKAVKKMLEGGKVYFILYTPEAECFYKGEDPFYLVRKVPSLIWGRCYLREEVPDPSLMDIYRCITNFELLSFASHEELSEHFKYVLDQVKFVELKPTDLIIPEGDKNGGPVYEDFVSEARKYLEENNLETFKNAVRGLLELTSPKLYYASILRWIDLLVDYLPKTKDIIEALLQSLETETPPVFEVKKEISISPEISIKMSLPKEFLDILKTQRIVVEKLKNIEDALLKTNILKSIFLTIENGLTSLKRTDLLKEIKEIAEKTTPHNLKPLEDWLNKLREAKPEPPKQPEELKQPEYLERPELPEQPEQIKPEPSATPITSRVLKVDESKIDRLMNLIGEFVVAKNSLAYLAQKADAVYGVPELSKELKAQYSVLNRISEEMQDAIMQVRMVPVSTVFQRFPRLVRDLSKKLGKKVKLIIEGEETEADKNVIEALADPLIHIIRNSLDHGIEPPEERVAKGKPEIGTIILRAKQEADQVVIEVIDDGRGIDPEKVKLKAYEKGLISEEQFEKMKDTEALNLIFLPGFSTKDVASDLSGRGVGMDVVKTTVERFGGSVSVKSTLDQGTVITLSLPLSMAVSHVMIIESAGEKFGIPMENVVETVRVSKKEIQTIKGKMTTVLRNKVVPLFCLNDLLDIDQPHLTNEDGEYAVLVLSVKGELVGVIVDRFHETADIILKPFTGFLAGLRLFSGTAIMGDGSVLLIINPKELINAGRN